MLKLPTGKDLKVESNLDEEDHLFDMSRKWLEKEQRTPGIHVSSILDPMYAYWEAKFPRKLNRREVTTFLVGKILHAFLISAADGVKGVNWDSDKGSRHSADFDMEYSMDYTKKGEPIEIKTSRSYYPPKGIKDLAMYLEQVLCYAVLEVKRKAKLWVLYLNVKDEDGRTCPEFRAYDVTISEKGAKEYEAQIRDAHAKLTKALKTSNPSKLENCRAWKCGPKMCPHWKRCKPKNRYEFGDDKKQWKDKTGL